MIVIIAREDDRHSQVVAAQLRHHHGERVVIVDLSHFPARARLSAHLDGPASFCRFLDAGGESVDLFAVKSFWWRRPQAITPDPRISDPQVQSFAQNESLSAVYGILRVCPGLWMNDIDRDQAADFKPLQLATARALGFSVPDTLIANDPAEVRAFADRHGGEIVFKAFNQRGLLWQPTRKMRPEDMGHLDSLAVAPVIFQQYVPGRRDIRVTVVGETHFATEFDISGLSQVDHRLALDTAPCAAHDLPADVAQKAVGLVRTLGLEYGSVDLRQAPDGAYHFFEINTAGEFLYLQERSGQPIHEAVAAHLARGMPACAPRQASIQTAQTGGHP